MMFNFLTSAVLLTYVSSVFAAPSSSGVTAPTGRRVAAPPGFNITSFGVNGSGCPAGSTFYLLNVDKTAVTVTFNSYFAQAGPNIASSQNRKACQLTIGVSVPPGFTYGIATIDYRGYYQLDAKVTASQQTNYYFQGQLLQATARSDLVGPVPGADYTYRDSFDLVSSVQSPCGINSIMNVQSNLAVSNAKDTKASGYIATDSIDTALITTLNFQWQTC